MTRPLADELAKHEIRVNTLSINWLSHPHFIFRELHDFMYRESARTERERKRGLNFDYTHNIDGFLFDNPMTNLTPPINVLDLIHHVATNSYINGEVITVGSIERMVL